MSVIFLLSIEMRTEYGNKKTWSFQLVSRTTFSFPEQYGASHKGHKLRREQLREVAETSGVLQVRHFDFMEQEVKRQCEHYLPNVNKVKSMNAMRPFGLSNKE